MIDKTDPPSHDAGKSGASDLWPDLHINHSLVLVVGRSQVNRVVVSRIVERSGLKATSETPDAALRTLGSVFPGTVILDGGADNAECQALMEPLLSMRRRTDNHFPAIVLLSTHKIDGPALARLTAIDAVVSKPILPEMLQPVVDRLAHRTIG